MKAAFCAKGMFPALDLWEKMIFLFTIFFLPMNRALYFSLIVSAIALLPGRLLAQGFALDKFEVTPNGADVLLQWETQDEGGVSEYRIYRKFNDDASFEFVATVQTDGSGVYQYLDDDIFKNDARVIHYELHAVKGSRIYKFQINLAHNPTSVQRTWGSIKSMFR